jgi:hypothetical protein
LQTPTNQIDTVTLLCRGVDIATTSGVPSANTDIAFALELALKASPVFDSTNTSLAGDNGIAVDPATGTFTFGIKLKMKRPLKVQ